MTVHDLWKGLTKAEIAERRAKNLVRWQRRWRGPELDPHTGKPKQNKTSYKEHQRVQADLDDANQRADPKTQRIRRESVTVSTLLHRHLDAKADRAPKTVSADQYHAQAVQEAFGDRYVATLDPTEIEIWSQRKDVARSSRKKQLEMLRAAIKRAARDSLVDTDPTEGLVVSLGHRELPYWSSADLMTVLDAAANDSHRAMLGLLGLMGLRRGEALSLRVGDLAAGVLSVKNAGSGSDTTKTRASRRNLPVPAAVLPALTQQAGNRPKAEYLFSSSDDPYTPRSEKYVSGALNRAIGRANEQRTDPIDRLNVHGLRHTFAAISLSEAGADILSVSRAMGHAKPSVTLDKYGHLAPAGLAPLMARIDDTVATHTNDVSSVGLQEREAES